MRGGDDARGMAMPTFQCCGGGAHPALGEAAQLADENLVLAQLVHVVVRGTGKQRETPEKEVRRDLESTSGKMQLGPVSTDNVEFRCGAVTGIGLTWRSRSASLAFLAASSTGAEGIAGERGREGERERGREGEREPQISSTRDTIGLRAPCSDGEPERSVPTRLGVLHVKILPQL